MSELNPRPTRELATRLALVVGSVLIVLVTVELGLRIFHSAGRPRRGTVAEGLARSESAELPDTEDRDFSISLQGLVRESGHPEIVYELKPLLEGFFLGEPLRTSSVGTRDRERVPANPDGCFRIVGLGDSVMFGWGVGQAEVYTAVLEERLGRVATPDRCYEVLNFAVPGYNTVMEVATLKHRALAFGPDLVLVHFVPNDLNLPYFLRRPERSWYPGEWYVTDLLRFGWRTAAGGRDDFVPFNEPEISPAELARLEEPYRRMAGEEPYRRSMAELARLGDEHGFRIVVLLMAEKHRLADLVREVADRHGMDILTPRHRFKEYLSREGLASADWDETFRIPGDGHPNAVAHGVYAAAIRRWLVDEGLVPRRRSPNLDRPSGPE